MEVCENQSPRVQNRESIRSEFSISLVLPAYNEQDVIEQAVREADEALASLTSDYEILVVDDGSTDETARLVSHLSTQREHVRLIRQPRNLGYGAALRRGFSEAHCELVGFTDSDCQFHVQELDRLAMLARDYDIVCGYRIDRQDPFRRRFYSKVYNLLIQAMFGTGVRDIDCALKLFHRETLAEISITTDGYLVNTEVLTQARLQERSIVEVGVTHRPRAAGESKVSIWHVFPVLLAMVRFWWNFLMFPKADSSADAEKGAWPFSWRLATVGCLTIIGVTIWFSNLGYPLIEPDETRYAQIGLEMYETGDWVVPRLQGEPYLDKPPLLYWATAASYSLFGVSQQSARLPNALAMFATVLAVYVLGRRLVGDRAASISAVALMLCAGVAVSARFLLLDSTLTCFTTFGLLCAGIALHAPRRRWVWWILVGIAGGLGIMTKGPVALIICVPPLVAGTWLRGERFAQQPLRWLLIAVPALGVAAPWFWAVMKAQPDFAEYFFWKHNVMRYVQGLNHEQPWWFYIPVVAAGMFPTSLFLPAFVVYLFRRRDSVRQRRTSELGFVTFAGFWVLLFFSASTCKLPTYILPAIPMLCLGIGKMLSDMVWTVEPIAFFKQYAERAAVIATASLLFGCMAAGVADLVFGTPSTAGHALAVFFIAAPLVLLVALLLPRTQQIRTSWAVAVVLALIAGGYAFDFVLPQFASWRSVSSNVATTSAELGEALPVVYYRHSRDAATLSLDASKIVSFGEDESDDFQRFVARHPLAIVVTEPSNADRIIEASDGTISLEPHTARHIYLSRSNVAATAANGAAQPMR